ncbi:MAG: OmpP1/FadL family transporter [Gemmatimonadota bacterium]
MRRVFLLAVAVAVWVAPVRAQESVFNLPLPGLPGSGESVRSRGMGGAPVGLMAESFSMGNPAWIAGFERAGLYLSLLGQRTTAEDSQTSGDFDDVMFPMGQAVIPAFGAVIGIGYYQHLDFDASIESSVLFEGDTVPVGFASDGGVGVIVPALAYPLNEQTSAGVSLDFYLGSREVVRSISIPGELATRDTLARDFGGAGLTLGITRELWEGTRLGLAYRFRPDLDSEVTRAGDPDLLGRKSEIRLPDELIVEASVGLSERLRLGAGLRYAGWEGAFQEDLAAEETELGDAWEVGGGIEFAPESPVALVIGPEAPLRVGYRWSRLPIRIDGEPVSEWALALGYSRGFSDLSRVDVAVEYGRRGDLETNVVSERFVRVGVGLGVFEIWRRID